MFFRRQSGLLRHYRRDTIAECRISDVWVRTCQACGARKPVKSNSKTTIIPIPATQSFERLQVDILGPLPLTKLGNRYIVVFIDSFTKWVEAFPTSSITAATIAEMFYKEIICRFGCPRSILSDRGKQFDCQLFKELCQLTNTTQLLTSGYNPRCNGLVERMNSTILTSISSYVSSHKKDWDIFWPGLIHACRCSIHPTTKESPFFL